MTDHEGWDMAPPPRVESTPRWIRASLGGQIVADSKQAMLHLAYGPPLLPDDRRPQLPGYFFPTDDVDTEVLAPAGEHHERRWWDVEVDDVRVAETAWAYLDPAGPTADLADHVTFRWDAMDAWYEEAEQVFVHARDPHKRVDVLESSRNVVVSLDGVELAASDEPFLLFETHLPTRYYLPVADVRTDLLVESDTRTACPYKGVATHWSIAGAGDAGRDIAWSYPDPIPEQPKLAGVMAFYNEKVQLDVDGETLERPTTPWS